MKSVTRVWKIISCCCSENTNHGHVAMFLVHEKSKSSSFYNSGRELYLNAFKSTKILQVIKTEVKCFIMSAEALSSKKSDSSTSVDKSSSSTKSGRSSKRAKTSKISGKDKGIE